jgi:adenylylsulfate kinase
MVIWLIGLSGSGKTAIGTALRELIVRSGKSCVFLDGDIIREIMGNDLGHTLEDRRRNAGRICRLCKHLYDQQINVVCGVLSLFHESQDWNRANIGDYFEVFLDAPLEVLIRRDNKGLYRRAAAGELRNVAGIDLEFPRPKSPDLVVANDFSQSVDGYAAQIFGRVRERIAAQRAPN